MNTNRVEMGAEKREKESNVNDTTIKLLLLRRGPGQNLPVWIRERTCKTITFDESLTSL